MTSLVPQVLLAIEKLYNRYTSFPRARFACSRAIFWGVRHLRFKVPLLRLKSGLVFEYSVSVARDVLVRDLLITGSFEPSQTRIMEELLPKGGVFLDVGANLGYFSVIGARAVGPTGRVYAFEPVNEIYLLLCRNIALNGLRNVEARHEACFSSSGMMRIERTSDSGKSHLSPGREAGEAVLVTTLDDFVTRAGIARIDLIKVDAEGCDLEVLKGAKRTIELLRPAMILEVNHLSRFGGSQSDALQVLYEHGYTVCEIRGRHSTDLVCKPSPSRTSLL